MSSATTLYNSRKVGLSMVGDALYVGNAKIVTPDMTATNGVIHVIDTVLTLPALVPTKFAGGRVAYCAVAGDTTIAGKPTPAWKVPNLRFGQPAWDYHYVAATLAIYVDKKGLTCAAPSDGYVLDGTAPDELHVPGGLYSYYVKR